MNIYAYKDNTLLTTGYDSSRLKKLISDVKIGYYDILPIDIKDETGAIVETIQSIKYENPYEYARYERYDGLVQIVIDQFGFVVGIF